MMDTIEERTEQTEEEPLPGLASRYLNVFVSPGALFDRLRERPVWAGAALLGAVFALAAGALIPVDITMAALREQMMAQGRSMPPGLEAGAKFMRIGLGVFGFIFWFVMVAFFAGIVTFVFAFVMGHEGRYRQYLAVVAHTQLIAATGALLIVPLRISTRDPELVLSVGTFLPFLGDGYLLRWMSLLDLFGLWGWVLVGLGAATVGRKGSWVSAAIIMLTIPVGMSALIAIFTG